MDRTIEVSDLPTGLSKRSLEDKLMIHFLRAKNGGGEIIDVVFPTEFLSSALIVFEEAEVAQRVLQTENQILTVNGKQHKLKVKSADSEIKVDQVIPHISMTIDYGKLLDGKRLMKRLQKTHRDIQFGFDPKVEQCTVGGTFSAVKELSGKIHHLLTLNSDQSSASLNETKHQLQDSPESADFSGSNSARKDTWKSSAASNAKGDSLESQTKSRLESSLRGRRGGDLQQFKEDRTSILEDYTLLMDSDIYMYIQKFYKDRYQNILHKYRVEVIDMSNEGITTAILHSAPGCLDCGASLLRAHHELSQLYQEFEFRLRKEQVEKGSLTSDVNLLQNIYINLKAQFPQINFHEDPKYFYLIGTSNDCSLAKKYLQDLKEELEIISQKERYVTSGSLPESHQTTNSSASYCLHEFKDSGSLNQHGSDVRKDHKLAPTFSGKREVDSAYLAGSSVAKDDLVVKPEQTADQLMTGFSKARSPPTDTRNWDQQQVPKHNTTTDEILTNTNKSLVSGTGQLVTPKRGSLAKSNKDFSVLTDQAKLLKSPDKTGCDILFKGDEDSSSLCTNKGLRHFQYNKSNKAQGPVKPCHFETSAGTLFHQGELLDTMQTAHSIATTNNSEGPSTKTPLRRTSSFSGCLKSKRPSEALSSFKERPTEVALFTEEILLDSDVWSYLKDIHALTIRQIISSTDVMVNEQLLGDTTGLKLAAQNKDHVKAAKEDILSVYTLIMKHLTQQLLPYRDLGIETITEETVAIWKSKLKKNFPKVKFIVSQTGFHIIGTYENCFKVIASFKPELKYASVEDLPWMDTTSISAYNQHPFLEAEKSKDAAEENLTKSASSLSSLGQFPDGRKSEDLNTSDVHTGSVSLQTTAKREQALFQSNSEPTETTGQGKAAESSSTCSSQPDGEEQLLYKQMKNLNERDSPVFISRQEPSQFMNQKRSPKTLDEGSSFDSLHGQVDYKCPKMIKQVGDVEGINVKKTLPDKFHFASNKLTKESQWYNKASSLHHSKVDSGMQSLPVSYTGILASSLHQGNYGQYITKSATDSKDQMQAKYVEQQTERNEIMPQESKVMRNSQQSQPRSPAIGMDAQELSEPAMACNNCKKSDKLSKVDCGQCRANVQNKNESRCMPTMKFSILNISLDGFQRAMTIQITYDIPDGIQGESDPNPGEPFKGGEFRAYLPESPEGKKVLGLLKEAFNKGLIFKVAANPPRPAHVTWNAIPHKTAITGGRQKNGYPDPYYMKKVLAALAEHGLQ
ncbi:uncharacterized protein si:busm1-163l24.3 [Hypanus sabinus]|uniref:uncharacterized protein si:busm1-163l24.3 n=1 Tax=Hypanus sabinus TaxID=79690 RepID=UPI0028C3CC47|nr:uncharacterized protein si:busm1-163l24.3 [Hypanus sabinus]XP_059812501.1 uncharacterized protein si:busm1-163l24.3 [Hypanus sabinus]